MVGLTVGFADVDVNPAGELVQEYVSPLKAEEAPIETAVPEQIVVLALTDAEGTEIVSEWVALQPVASTCSVRV